MAFLLRICVFCAVFLVGTTVSGASIAAIGAVGSPTTTQNPPESAAEDTASPQRPALPTARPSPEALAVVDFEKKRFYLGREFRKTVEKSQEKNPDAIYTVISRLPDIRSASTAEKRRARESAEEQTMEIVKSLREQGIRPSQIRVFTRVYTGRPDERLPPEHHQVSVFAE